MLHCLLASPCCDPRNSADVTRGLTRVEYCHVSLWFMTYMCLKCWICLKPVIPWLCLVSLADVVCCRELDQWFRCNLGSMATIESQYRILRFRSSWCQDILALQSLDPRYSDTGCDQRSRALLIQQLWLHHKIAYRDFGVFVVIVHETRETPIPDSPMKPPIYTWMVLITAWFNDYDQIAKSHITISGFSMSIELDI